jgi:hypothetical protein
MGKVHTAHHLSKTPEPSPRTTLLSTKGLSDVWTPRGGDHPPFIHAKACRRISNLRMSKYRQYQRDTNEFLETTSQHLTGLHFGTR